MGYSPNAVPEMVRRTRKNLQFIADQRRQRLAAGIDVDFEGPFEVTQLVNSFLGAFAHPFEALFKARRPSQELTRDLERLDHLLNREIPDGQERPLIQDTLGYVQNAFAHGNVEFIPGPSARTGRQDIVKVRIWNCRKTNKTWDQTFTVDELENILLTFMDAMTRVPASMFERSVDCPPRPERASARN